MGGDGFHARCAVRAAGAVHARVASFIMQAVDSTALLQGTGRFAKSSWAALGTLQARRRGQPDGGYATLMIFLGEDTSVGEEGCKGAH